ncbi:SDR family NAD(P)-dependent oxidoreductase [Staphylococcus pseudoxylosus]|uniref:SDR family NAD(P)-dependent oxidoreductase n=1 Tax=Staphylococcus pseudoxylosus TaxID=2282419 RepID=UPI00298F1988|nr:SDR family NAD(P)-dependent oxidoreductase [Staphylococcus pseudoxylosus]MDW8546267.1 SDR family NAD(P)-dependent oxidoreductase [Staphylococcus pseudoxylosus]
MFTKEDYHMNQNSMYKTILVIGATSGIGKIITKEITTNMNIVSVARNQNKLNSLASELNNDATLLTIQANYI